MAKNVSRRISEATTFFSLAKQFNKLYIANKPFSNYKRNHTMIYFYSYNFFSLIIENSLKYDHTMTFFSIAKERG